MSVLLSRHGPLDPVCFGGEGMRTRSELVALSRRIAAALPAARAESGVVVACRDRYFFSAAMLGAFLRGYRVFLPSNGQSEAVRKLSRSSFAVALLHDVPEETEGLDVRGLEAKAGSDGAPLLLDAEQLGVVLFTSGSTGAPVAHAKTLAQLLAEASAHVDEFTLSGRRVVAGVPPHHIYGLLFSVLAPLLGGGSVLRHTPLFPRELTGLLETYGADVLVSVPPQLSALAEDHALPLPPLVRTFCSAGPLGRETARRLEARGLGITEVLGSTETGGFAYREQYDAPFRALRGVDLSIDEEGVLWVDAPWLSAQQPRPLRTADRAEPWGPGFRHLGRVDAVTKVAGRRVDLGDVEACLRKVPSVRDARVLAVPGKGVRGVTLWAVVEAPHDLAIETLRTALSERLDPVTHPKRFRCVRALPRTESGKVTRAALLALFDTWELRFESLPEGDVEVEVPLNLGFVRGHFAEEPILPGVVQLRHIALAEVRRRFPELGVVARVTRVKFKRIVRPGERVVLSIVRKGPHQVQFAMRVGAESACSGIFHFKDGGTMAACQHETSS